MQTVSLPTQLRYGRPGDPIPGSRYPIRVPREAQLGLNECADCQGLIPAKVLSQQRARRCDYGPALRAGGHR